MTRHEPAIASADTLARHLTERGELVLRRRADGHLELRVNGVFAMDTAETVSERLLGESALAALHAAQTDAPEPLRVFVGGLGLGFTLAAVLDDAAVGEVVVCEIESGLVSWHRGGLVPPPGGRPLLDDPRVDLRVADVRTEVAGWRGAGFDLILLDVDNGPDFLVYDANAEVYTLAFLRRCAALVADRRGVLAVWSADESPALSQVLADVFGFSDVEAVPVVLGTRATNYHLYLGSHTRLYGDR